MSAKKNGMDDSGMNYKAADTVSDSYLIAAFAREVRKMMMIFDAQRMNEKNKSFTKQGSNVSGNNKELSCV